MAAFVGRMASRGIGLGKALFTTGPGLATLAGVGAGSVALQGQFGTGKDFFHHKFTTTKNPDKIVDFYSTEEFLQILGIFNFATNFVLAGVVWATDTDQKNTVRQHSRLNPNQTPGCSGRRRGQCSSYDRGQGLASTLDQNPITLPLPLTRCGT